MSSDEIAASIPFLPVGGDGLFELLPEGIVTIDGSGTVVGFSTAAVRMFGFEREDVLGRPLEMLLPSVVRGRHQAMVDSFAAGDSGPRHTMNRAPISAVRRDGTEFTAEVSIARFNTPDGTRMMAVLRDMTEYEEQRQQLVDNESRFKALLRHSSDYVLVMGEDGEVQFASESIVGVLGYVPEDVVGRNMAEFLDPDDLDEAVLALVEAYAGETVATRSFRAIHADGSTLHIECAVSNALDDPTVNGIVVNVRDVSDRTAAESEARIAREQVGVQRDRFRQLVERVADAILVVTANDTISYASPAAAALFGQELGEYTDLRALVSRAFDATTLAEIGTRLASMGHGECEQVTGPFRDTDEHDARQVEMTFTNLLEDPSIQGTVVHIRDVTDRHRHLQLLTSRTLTDELTGLANRRRLLDHLTRELAGEGGGVHLGLLFLDVDRFKLVNDSHGHATGDKLLRVLADRLRQTVRQSDLVARFGGDEFVIVHRLEGSTAQERHASAMSLSQRIIHEVNRPTDLDGVQVTPSLSIGLTFNDGASDTAESLIRDADTALYKAKEHGRHRISVFDPQTRHLAQRRLRLEQDLVAAIAADELQLAYQPIVELATGQVAGCEALARWTHPELGPVTPAEFIPIAEDIGKIGELGRWAIRTVCSRLAEPAAWGDSRPDYVAVNVSAQQFEDPAFAPDLLAMVAFHEIDPSRLVLELTEETLLLDSPEFRHALDRIRSHGIRLSLDDFGTGYSSLSYLGRYPLDFLKIDRNFIIDIDRQRPTVAAIIAMADALDLVVIAEGVETPEQLEELAHLGCRYAQGFLFARPGAASELTTHVPMNEYGIATAPSRTTGPPTSG